MTGNEIKNDYDIVIVGAGPSGCSVANFLDKGYKILMIDWSSFPRDKPCGGLLTEESKKFLSKIKLPESVFSEPEEIGMRYIDWDNDLEINRKNRFLNIDRKKFDYFLLNLSKNNIDFSSNTKFLFFDKSEDGLRIFVEKDNKRKIIKSRYIIGADGAFSAVRRGITKKDLTRYLTIQEWSTEKNGMETFDYILSNDLTDFYSWTIPKGNSLILGSALSLKDNTFEKFELFKKRLKDRCLLKCSAGKRESALISRPKHIDEVILGNENVFLVGESAGLISPSSGDGISFALRSGFSCAQAINKDFQSSLENYLEISQPLVNEIAKKLEKSKILSNPSLRKNVMSKLE